MRLIDADALKSELIAFYADSAELFNEVSCLVDSAMDLLQDHTDHGGIFRRENVSPD